MERTEVDLTLSCPYLTSDAVIESYALLSLPTANSFVAKKLSSCLL